MAAKYHRNGSIDLALGGIGSEFRASKFDFQTDEWQATSMAAAALATLPGRPCPIAAALELVGERWALLIVREIALGAHKFSELVRGTGAPRDRVAARLKTLEQAGVIARVPYQTAPPRDEYQLTESGRALLPVLDALLAWGRDYAVAATDPDRPRHHRTISQHVARTKEQP
jgi:DNA-binding HxlR family transcriptional regulator